MIAKVWLKFLNFTAFARETARGISAMQTVYLRILPQIYRGKIAARGISWIKRAKFLTAEF
jgi:hypothetical protein